MFMKLKSGEELIKYITEQTVEYIERPKAEKKQQRTFRKDQKEPWSYKWFGMVPMAFHMWKQKRQSKK
jgi:hypothetical protein